MAEYAVTFSRSTRKELEKFPPQFVERIFPKIDSLGAKLIETKDP